MSTFPGSSAGAVAVIDVSELMMNEDAGVGPKVTAVTADKPIPVMVTTVPPVCGPERGFTPVTAAAVKVNWSAVVATLVPSGVVTVTSTVPTGSSGVVAVIDVSEVATNDADAVPKSTSVAPLKPLPVMTTDVPPVAWPESGLTLFTVGGVKMNSSAVVAALVPSGVVTVTSTVPTGSAGVVALIEVSESTTNGADVLPKLTAVAPVKPLPLMVIVVPPVAGPEVGLTAVTVGGVNVN
jgi:hypothetical protein